MYRYFFLPMLVLLLATGTVNAAGEKLLLVGSGEPDPKDILLVDYLEEWGYEIELREHLATSRYLAVIDFVFISLILIKCQTFWRHAKLRESPECAETWTYDDMGFAPDGTFNSDAGDDLTIVNTDHPITEGFKDKITVSKPAASLMTCNGFEGDIDVLAVRADNDDFVAISVYEKGAKTIKGSTKAIHVNIWPHSTGWQMVTDDGWELIHRSILYALGQIPFDVAPEDKLAVAWGQIKVAR